MSSKTKAALVTEVKSLMRKLRYTEHDIEEHYEMIILKGKTLSYLRHPDHCLTNEDIPMDILRYVRNDLLDCLP